MSRYIDADKLQTRMLNYYSDSWRLCEEINDFFANIPTADVRENVRGYNTKKDKYFHCSICGYGVNDVYESSKSDVLIFEHGEEWKFCPCCGAEIMEENNE